MEISVLTGLCRPSFLNIKTCICQCIATLTVYTIKIINQSSKQANQLTLLYTSKEPVHTRPNLGATHCQRSDTNHT